MKKTVSFNLEEDIIKRIEDYQKINDLSSRSSALERMILLQGTQSITKQDLIPIISELIKDMNLSTNKVKEVEKKIDDIDKSITEIFDNIPD